MNIQALMQGLGAQQGAQQAPAALPQVPPQVPPQAAPQQGMIPGAPGAPAGPQQGATPQFAKVGAIIDAISRDDEQGEAVFQKLANSGQPPPNIEVLVNLMDQMGEAQKKGIDPQQFIMQILGQGQGGAQPPPPQVPGVNPMGGL